MKKAIVFLAATLAAMLCSISCIHVNGHAKRICGSGNIVTHNIGSLGYEGIDASYSVKVIVTEPASSDVIVRADDNLLEYVELKVRDGILEVSLDEKMRGTDMQECTIEIFVPDNGRIRSLKASGASRIEVRTPLHADEMEIEASGASHICGDIEARELEAEISGASGAQLTLKADECSIETSGASNLTACITGRCCRAEASGASKATLSGTVREAELKAGGASTLKAEELTTLDCSVSVGGASSATVNCSNRLTVSAGGASSVRYTGDCQLVKCTSSGASSVSRK